MSEQTTSNIPERPNARFDVVVRPICEDEAHDPWNNWIAEEVAFDPTTVLRLDTGFIYGDMVLLRFEYQEHQMRFDIAFGILVYFCSAVAHTLRGSLFGSCQDDDSHLIVRLSSADEVEATDSFMGYLYLFRRHANQDGTFNPFGTTNIRPYYTYYLWSRIARALGMFQLQREFQGYLLEMQYRTGRPWRIQISDLQLILRNLAVGHELREAILKSISLARQDGYLINGGEIGTLLQWNNTVPLDDWADVGQIEDGLVLQEENDLQILHRG